MSIFRWHLCNLASWFNLLDNFLNHLNFTYPNIQLTTELQHDIHLPFLDIITKRRIDGSSDHGIYRKPMKANLYNNASSHKHSADNGSMMIISWYMSVYKTDENPKYSHIICYCIKYNTISLRAKVLRCNLLPNTIKNLCSCWSSLWTY